MRLAERALREEAVPVAVVGQSLGYASESAFSNAFKRVTGNSPRAYRNGARDLGSYATGSQVNGAHSRGAPTSAASPPGSEDIADVKYG